MGRNDYGAARALNVESRSLKREETPDDLVGALLFLALHDNDFMTGRRYSWMAARRCINVQMATAKFTANAFPSLQGANPNG
jgi:hypothetical protein